MKKLKLLCLTLLAAAALLAGCAEPQATAPAVSGTREETAPVTEGTPTTEDRLAAERELYAAPIALYRQALSENWSEGDCLERGVSGQLSYYYEGNALANVGIAFPDVDNDGQAELVIGAIYNADKDPAVFEIWTQKDGKAVLLAQSGSRNRYYLYEEDGSEGLGYSVANEAENGAANHATHYLELKDGKLTVREAILFDAIANEDHPWFLARDYDWDTSNDQSVEESYANQYLSFRRGRFLALPYAPFEAL